MKSLIATKEYLVWKGCKFTRRGTIGGDCQGATIVCWIKMKILMLIIKHCCSTKSDIMHPVFNGIIRVGFAVVYSTSTTHG